MLFRSVSQSRYRPILNHNPLPTNNIYVLELSNYQINITQNLNYNITILTNITPNHLNHYNKFENYATSKKKLFTIQSPNHITIITIKNEPNQTITTQHPTRSPFTQPISKTRITNPPYRTPTTPKILPSPYNSHML